jgi:hypothetical protein
MGVVMGGVMVKSLEEPDETRAFPNGATQMVTVGPMLLGRARMEPGWRWSNDVKPIAGTDQCMVLHKGYCVSGALVVRAEDGTETRIHAGDGYVIEPGHDAWVDGDEAYVGIDVSEQMKDYAKPK